MTIDESEVRRLTARAIPEPPPDVVRSVVGAATAHAVRRSSHLAFARSTATALVVVGVAAGTMYAISQAGSGPRKQLTNAARGQTTCTAMALQARRYYSPADVSGTPSDSLVKFRIVNVSTSGCTLEGYPAGLQASTTDLGQSFPNVTKPAAAVSVRQGVSGRDFSPSAIYLASGENAYVAFALPDTSAVSPSGRGLLKVDALILAGGEKVPLLRNERDPLTDPYAVAVVASPTDVLELTPFLPTPP